MNSVQGGTTDAPTLLSSQCLVSVVLVLNGTNADLPLHRGGNCRRHRLAANSFFSVGGRPTASRAALLAAWLNRPSMNTSAVSPRMLTLS
jgi:hypothetical protein